MKMPVDCQRSTSGGKGNMGKFVDRHPRICAAGLPSQQPDEDVGGALQHYLLQDHAAALLSDAMLPPAAPSPRPPLRRPPPHDMRNAGPYGDVAALVNPPMESKIQALIEDLKCTPFKSYWTKPLGQVKDPVPMFPIGFDIEGTTYGKKLKRDDTLYDVVMPKNPPPDMTPRSKQPCFQVCRNYCQPSYNADLTYGYRTNIDKRGRYARCCLTDDNITQGTAARSIVNFIKADYDAKMKPAAGEVLSPNNNLRELPQGYRFGALAPPGNLPQCLANCDLNPERTFFLKCLAHLNSLRKIMSTRFLPSFYRTAYLNLKYFDTDKSGWLQKEVVYEYCASKHIRFDPSLIEPLLFLWKAFDGSRIEYKTFVFTINYKERIPNLPKIPDLPPECLDFTTTYREMVQPGQEADSRLMAGVPSGRYFDLNYPKTPDCYCRTDRINLSDETDMRCCLQPSILTQLTVTHRDMFAKREPDLVKRVFKAAGETFTEEQFDAIWEEAKKYHSEGWVCYETFRKAMNSFLERKDAKNEDNNSK